MLRPGSLCVALALTSALIAGCDDSESSSSSSSSSSGTSGTSSFRSTVTFKPSLVADAVEGAFARGELAGVGDLVIDKNCGNSAFATVRMGEASVCGGTGTTKFLYVAQPGGAAAPSGPLPYSLPSPIANAPPVLTVVVAKNIRLAAGTTLYAQSGSALVLFALDTMTIEGTLDVGPLLDSGARGAGTSPLQETTPEKGAGAGGGQSAKRDPKRAGGGGTFCGRGGFGASTTPYGTPELLPLVAGSDGGSGVGKGGAGGGAVALIAGRSITVAPTGIITSPGNGGGRGDFGAGGTLGLGGGSGGAILLEAPTVDVNGIVAANGGGGGGPADQQGDRGGNNGGDTTPTEKAGGAGGAGTRTDGGEPAPSADGLSGGGGGGAGRIRINGTTINAPGTVSPALTTSCGTQGGLASW